MDLLIEIVGWSAAGVLLGAYALLSRGRLSGQGSSFQTLNVVGSLLVGVNSFAHEAWPSVSVNVVWLVIGVATLVATRRRHATHRTSDPSTSAPGHTPDPADTAAAAEPASPPRGRELATPATRGADGPPLADPPGSRTPTPRRPLPTTPARRTPGSRTPTPGRPLPTTPLRPTPGSRIPLRERHSRAPRSVESGSG